MNIQETAGFVSDKQARAAILDIGDRMYRSGMVAANDGNISVKVGPNALWVTPTGVSKGYMTEDMLVKVDLDGNILEGTWKTSSELKMHLGVYKANPDIMSVSHSHPPVATSFAIAGIALDAALLTEAVIGLGPVPVAPYATPGTDEVPQSVQPFVRDYNAVLMANHGLLTWGRDAYDAYFRMEMIEHYAKMVMYSSFIIGRVNLLSADQAALMTKRRADDQFAVGGRMQTSDTATNLEGFISLPLPERDL